MTDPNSQPEACSSQPRPPIRAEWIEDSVADRSTLHLSVSAEKLNLFNVLNSIPGLITFTVYPYSIFVRKGRMFPWSEIYPLIEAAVAKATGRALTFPSDAPQPTPEPSGSSSTLACDCGNPQALYVWEDVLTDYTPGMAVVLACCEPRAWELLAAKDDKAAAAMNRSSREDRTIDPTRESRDVPVRVERPEAFVCWGGG